MQYFQILDIALWVRVILTYLGWPFKVELLVSYNILFNMQGEQMLTGPIVK